MDGMDTNYNEAGHEKNHRQKKVRRNEDEVNNDAREHATTTVIQPVLGILVCTAKVLPH